MSLVANIIKKTKLNWNFGVNATYNTNEITKLTLVNDPSYVGVLNGGISGAVGNTIRIHSVGYRPASFYVLQQVYDNNGKPIEGLYVDQNKDGIINKIKSKPIKNHVKAVRNLPVSPFCFFDLMLPI